MRLARWARPIVLTLLAASPGCDAGPARDAPIDGGILVLTTDFETGAFSVLDLASRRAARNVGLTHSDATARVAGGRVFVVNRLGQDNVTALDPADGYRILWQRSTEPGSNPQDIAVASADKAYVTRLERTSALVLDPRDGSPAGEVDLSALADADGFPEAAAALVVAGRVVVAVERLDRENAYLPTGRGALAIIDPATDRVERTIELTGRNPWGDMALDAAGRLLVAEVGRFGVLDGGIEAVDLSTGSADGFLVTEETLGGDVSAFAVVSDGSLWIVVSDPSFATSVVRFDPADGTRRTVRAGAGFTLACVAEIGEGLVAVCDRALSAPGVRLFGRDGVEQTAQPIDVGLPPWLVRVVGP